MEAGGAARRGMDPARTGIALQSRLPPDGRGCRGGTVPRDGQARSPGLLHMLDGFPALMYAASVWALPVVTAITLHEAAHAWVAWKLGDDTARRAGRLTFNPARHIDPFGTIVLPALLLLMRAPFLFGYAKPVPVDFGRLRRPRRDMIWVAAAGPGSNLVMAWLAALLMYATVVMPEAARPWVFENLKNALMLNVVLAVFNLLPIPPLDGSRVVLGLLPRGLAIRYARLERYGMALVVGLIALPPLAGMMLGLDFNLLIWILLPPVELFLDSILALAGHG